MKHLEINLTIQKRVVLWNLQTVPREIHENLNEWRDVTCSQITRHTLSQVQDTQNNVKMNVEQSWKTDLCGMASAERSAHRSVEWSRGPWRMAWVTQAGRQLRGERQEGLFNILEQLMSTCQAMSCDPYAT